MRKIIYPLVCSLFLILLIGGCGQFNFPADFKLPQQTQGLTSAEVIKGLKEALTVGAGNSVSFASKTDGFYKNPLLFVAFPPEAIKVKNTLESAGLNKPVDNFILSLNRAAEDASKRALPILKDAILGMTITDAMGILKGNETAATDYLKRKTTNHLKAEFTPVVRQSINKVDVTSYWNPIVTNYNRLTLLTGAEQVNPNLEEYITEKTIEGLFTLIAKEEVLIRKDPAARVTDILRKVFAEQ
ncbi:MAG: DUF4197 domain-containing protein [Bacteroidales bacterium]|nr:DUF4197 domain-containing protein [Bacteroidales bacterium]MDD3892754.1 DUF4197 domain-containing protein [Bacteroidales bacterium]